VRRDRRAGIALIAAAVFSAAPARAQQSEPGASPAPANHLAAPDLFALADRAKATGQTDEAATLYDALAHDANPDVRAEARFRKAMMLAELRRYGDAAVALRALLDEQPGAVRARLELARVLAAMGDEPGARRALRQAQATGLPETAALTVEQFARALRSARPFGASFELAAAPDSNINRATQARTLDTVIAPLTLSKDARAQSGVGLKIGGQAFARIDLADGLALLPRVAGIGNFYREGAFNDVSASALLGLEWRRGRDRISPSLGETWRWYGGRPYARTAAASLDWLHPLNRQSQLLLHGGISRATYVRNTLQDGTIYDATLSYERALSARQGIGLTLNGYRQTARDPGYATWSAGASTLVWRDLGKVTLVASTGLYRLEGDARLFLFAQPRREWLLRSSLSGTFRQLTFAGFAPNTRLVLERNWSTVGLYDYRRIAVELGVARAF